jgi:hypothetical protein
VLTLVLKVQKYDLGTVSKFVSDAPEKYELELIELQYDSILRGIFNQEALITFYVYLPVSRFSVLPKLARKVVNAFGSTHM